MVDGKRRTRARGFLLVIFMAFLWPVLPSAGRALAADDSVPEFFGVYARDGDKLTELFSSKAPAEGQSFSEDVEIIFFRSELQTALGLAAAEKLTSLKAGVFVRQALVDLTASSKQKPHASQTVPIGRVEPSEQVDVRYAPIAAQPGTIRMRPREHLAPGQYFATFDKEVFAFVVELDGGATAEWQKSRCVDRKVLALDEKAAQTMDGGWEAFFRLGQSGLVAETISGHRILESSLQPCTAFDEAKSALLGDDKIDQCIEKPTSRCVFAAALEIVRRAPADILEGLPEPPLMLIAIAQAKAGHIDDALQTAKAIESPLPRAYALAEAGDIAGALKIANADTGVRSWSLRWISKAEVKAGNIAAARKIAKMIEDPHARALALWDAGDFAGALETAEAIGSEWILSQIQLYIAEAQAKAGNFTNALQTARAINDPGQRAQALAKAGDIAAALEIAKAIDDTLSCSSALMFISEAQAEIGDTASALQTARTIDEPMRRARALATAGDFGGAFETAMSIKSGGRNKALSHVVAVQAKSGDVTTALKNAKLIDDAFFRSSSLAEIGIALAERERATVSMPDQNATLAIRLDPYPLLSQKDSGNYRDPAFRDLPDTDFKGAWRTVKDLACLAAVYVMLERGRGNADKYIDDGLYDDPRGKEKGGAGAIAPSYVVHRTASDEPKLDIATVIAALKEERPSILHAVSQSAPFDHYVLVIGFEQKDGATTLIALDPWPGADRDGSGRELRLVVKPEGIWHPTIEGLRFDRMRLIQGS